MSNIAPSRRITIADLAQKKNRQEKWSMLTSYEQMTAEIFDDAGIPVLLVGDSAGNNFLGMENTIPVTVDELIPLARAVVAFANVYPVQAGAHTLTDFQALAGKGVIAGVDGHRVSDLHDGGSARDPRRHQRARGHPDGWW